MFNGSSFLLFYQFEVILNDDVTLKYVLNHWGIIKVNISESNQRLRPLSDRSQKQKRVVLALCHVCHEFPFVILQFHVNNCGVMYVKGQNIYFKPLYWRRFVNFMFSG